MGVKTLGSMYSSELERLFGLRNIVQKPANLDKELAEGYQHSKPALFVGVRSKLALPKKLGNPKQRK